MRAKFQDTGFKIKDKSSFCGFRLLYFTGALTGPGDSLVSNLWLQRNLVKHGRVQTYLSQAPDLIDILCNDNIQPLPKWLTSFFNLSFNIYANNHFIQKSTLPLWLIKISNHSPSTASKMAKGGRGRNFTSFINSLDNLVSYWSIPFRIWYLYTFSKD